jgi:hypothetical protein
MNIVNEYLRIFVCLVGWLGLEKSFHVAVQAAMAFRILLSLPPKCWDDKECAIIPHKIFLIIIKFW